MALNIHTTSLKAGSNRLSQQDRLIKGMYSVPTGVGGTTVGTTTVTAAGEGYQAIPTFTLSTTGSTRSAILAGTLKAINITVVNGGSGHTTGDLVTMPNGVVVAVTAASGVVTGATVSGGTATLTPPDHQPDLGTLSQVSSNGAGIGFSCTMTYGLSTVPIIDGGLGYTGNPTVTVVGANTTPATVTSARVTASGGALIVGVAGRFPSSKKYTAYAQADQAGTLYCSYKGTAGVAFTLTPATGVTLAAGNVDISVEH